MAKQNKAPEQDSAPAVQSDAEIMAEGQHAIWQSEHLCLRSCVGSGNGC